MSALNLKKVFKAKKSEKILNITIVLLLILIPVFVYYSGGTKTTYVHFLYIPIILSARSKKIYYVLAVAVIAGLIVGPYMPSDVRLGQMQPFQGWGLRIVMFMLVGSVVYMLNRKSRKDLFISRLVLHSFKEGVCMIDNTDTIVFTNERFATLHHLKVEEIINQNIYEFIDQNYSDINRTTEYYKLIDAIINKNTEKSLMIPRDLNSKGNIITEYDVNAIENQDHHGCIIVVKNIEDRLQYEENLYNLSYTDHLTGVKNRRAFQKYLSSLNKTKVLPVGILIIDIDGIKFINDSFGHQKGDEVIIQLAKIITRVVTQYGYTARYDGDEFIAVIDNATSELLDIIVDQITSLVNHIVVNSLTMSVSCGYAIATSLEEVEGTIKLAENNMYLDKNSSKNSIRNNPVETIINTLHEKDVYSEQHSKGVSVLSSNIAQALNLPGNQIKEITHAGLLHDIGKIIVPIGILTKNGSLTKEEYKVMQEHPAIGYRLLSSIKNLNNIPDMILAHHERWDGLGYPNQIKESEIPLGARIISVADSFNAMTTDRTYRKKLTNEEALEELIRCKGSQFDPVIIEAFYNNFEMIIG